MVSEITCGDGDDGGDGDGKGDRNGRGDDESDGDRDGDGDGDGPYPFGNMIARISATSVPDRAKVQGSWDQSPSDISVSSSFSSSS